MSAKAESATPANSLLFFERPMGPFHSPENWGKALTLVLKQPWKSDGESLSRRLVGLFYLYASSGEEERIAPFCLRLKRGVPERLLLVKKHRLKDGSLAYSILECKDSYNLETIIRKEYKKQPPSTKNVLRALRRELESYKWPD